MMKFIFENYRKHLQEQEMNELRTQILNEISEDDYSMIKKWMRNAPDEAYSFRNLFGNKKRIAIPVETGAADGPIGEIVRLFQDNDWEIDFSDSTVSKKMTTVIPKGPKAGEKITQTRKMRLGKALDYILKLIKNYEKIMEEYKEAGGYAAETAALVVGFDDSDKHIKELIAKKNAAYKKIESVLPEHATSFAAVGARIPRMIEFWSKKAPFYRQNPDAAFQKESPYVTILSRHPVDVVRMSDMNNIRSCHSRTGGYFQCAVAESRGHGPIAYLVPREQFEEYFDVDLNETNPEDVDLDQGGEEIFEDDQRGVSGLRPEGRVRLRKFVSKEDGRMITAPERKTYAPHDRATPPNFLKGVTKWAMDSQKNVIGDPKKLANEFYKEDWVRHGGSYEDTQDGEVMARMLEPLLDDEELLQDLSQAGNMAQSEEEDEREIERELDENSVERQAEIIQEEADQLKHFNVWHETGDDDSVQYNGGFGFVVDEELGEFPDPSPNPEYPVGWELHGEAINDAVKQALDQEAYIYTSDTGEIGSRNQTYRISIDPAHDEYQDLNGFSSFVSNLKDADDKFTAIMNNVREQLQDAGIIPTTGESVTKTLNSLDKIKGTIDPEEKHIRVTWKQRNKITYDLQEFKRFSAVDQEVIKQLWAREFRHHLADILNKLRKRFDFPISNIIVRSDRQILSPELDGVYGIMDFDLKYEDDQQMRLAAKLLEEMNKQGWNQSLRQVSANEYYGLLKDAEDQEPPFQEVPEDERRKATEIEGDARELNKFFESKKSKISDKMLFESWRRYLGK